MILPLNPDPRQLRMLQQTQARRLTT